MSAPTQKPPGPLLRLFFRVPLGLYRLGLGGWERLFGMRWLKITTVGRKTGLPRAVMVDLLDHDRATGRYYVQPGWGRASDWVKNIAANPVVEIQDGRRRFRARAIDVSGEEGAARASRFMQRHPMARVMAKRVLGLELPRSEDALRQYLAQNAVFLAFEPIDRE